MTESSLLVPLILKKKKKQLSRCDLDLKLALHPVNIHEKDLFVMVQYKLSSAYWIKYLALFYTDEAE